MITPASTSDKVLFLITQVNATFRQHLLIASWEVIRHELIASELLKRNIKTPCNCNTSRYSACVVYIKTRFSSVLKYPLLFTSTLVNNKYNCELLQPSFEL